MSDEMMKMPEPVAFAIQGAVDGEIVLVQAKHRFRSGTHFYTYADLEQAKEEATRQAMERCAAEFDEREARLPGSGWYEPHEPAEIIRALAKDQP